MSSIFGVSSEDDLPCSPVSKPSSLTVFVIIKGGGWQTCTCVESILNNYAVSIILSCYKNINIPYIFTVYQSAFHSQSSL